jgi:hypothetical protein
MEKKMAEASWFTATVKYIKVNGRKIKNMGKVIKNLQTDLFIKVTTSMENLKE